MPAFRIGFGSDFTLVNQLVGIGSTASRTKLEVDGGALKGDFNISGVSSLTQYAGFVPQIQNISVASTIGFTTTGIGSITGISTAAAVGVSSFVTVNERETGFVSLIGQYNSLSQDIVVDDGRIFDINTPQNIGVTTIGTQSVYTPGISTVTVGTLPNVSIGTHFSVPNGGIAARTQDPVEGMVRFNDDLNTLEFWNGFEWRQFTVSGRSGRGVWGGGGTPTTQSVIEYFNTSSFGNAINFGALTAARTGMGACASEIRGVFGGGTSISTNIEYITLASAGNGISFGSLTVGKEYGSGLSSSTRGMFGAGQAAPAQALTSVIDYITISTLGNAISFGNLLNATADISTCASPTRGIFGGGYTGPTSNMGRISTIQYVTISSTGNSVKFGDLTDRRSTLGACSNSVRGMFGGGAVVAPDNKVVVIDYITIASLGNSTNFGSLTQRRVQLGSLASQTRGFWGGGYATAPITNFLNIIDSVTIATTGDAINFGSLTQIKNYPAGLSDSHGGLGGF